MQPISPTMPSAFPVGDSKVQQERWRVKLTKEKHYCDSHTVTGSTYMSPLCHKVLWAAMFRSVECVSVLVARPVSLQASVTAFTLIMALLCFCVPHWSDGSKSNLHMAALIARSPATLTSQAAHFRDCPFMHLCLFLWGGAENKWREFYFSYEKVTVIRESRWTLMSNRKKSEITLLKYTV